MAYLALRAGPIIAEVCKRRKWPLYWVVAQFLKMTFSVAQAFTPGNRKAISFKSPINGALIAPLVFSPRRKRLGYRKPHAEIKPLPLLAGVVG
jgi:hypothetical protein